MHEQFLARIWSLAVTSLPAAAVPPQPIRAPVSALAAGESGAVALTTDDVRVMDAAGFPTGRLARTATNTRPAKRRTAGAIAADRFAAAAGVPSDADFNDPYDPDSEIEDPENILVEDEAPPRRRRATADERAPGVVLAAGGPFAWVGRQDGLWRLPFEGGAAIRVPLPAPGAVQAVATSADGRIVVAATGGGLAWSTDAGARFEAIPGALGRAPRLAVTASGRTFALDRGGLRRIGDPRRAVAIAVPDPEDLVSCGDVALVLSRQRIFVLGARSDGVEQAADEAVLQGPLVPAGARHLGCGPDGSMWVAYGPSLWTSVDRGRTWTGRDDVPALFAVDAVAVTRSALWVAGTAGLAVLPTVPTPVKAMAQRPRALTDLTPAGGPAPRWRWWMGALPRVDLGFATAQSNTRRDVRAFLLLSFAFDERRALRGAREIDADRVEVARRDEARRALARQGVTEGPPDGAVADEEREAMSRVMGE